VAQFETPVRILFVSNGHGEEAICARIADELAAILPTVSIDHLALVGEFGHPSVMNDVGPRRAMPSGGLVAMGNVRNIVGDVRAGLIPLTLAQLRFLRASRATYAAAVAVGDVFALLMALQTKAPATFVGTAKSVYVAPYGAIESLALRRARAIFVRDDATAKRLRADGVEAQAPGNVIVDLFATPEDPRADEAFAGYAPALVLFPGSRESSYDEARALGAVVRCLAASRPALGAVLSIAPGLRIDRFAETLAADGWNVRQHADARIPFVLGDAEREIVRAWSGPIGPLLARATLVVGQAGTANEAAAAAGIPVVALESATNKKNAWYRQRQRGLLGDALAIVPAETLRASDAIGVLLDDAAQRMRMGAIGRERMGRPGGAHAIARSIASHIEGSA
jgi:uncharacterized protein (TIGR03492 family)